MIIVAVMILTMTIVTMFAMIRMLIIVITAAAATWALFCSNVSHRQLCLVINAVDNDCGNCGQWLVVMTIKMFAKSGLLVLLVLHVASPITVTVSRFTYLHLQL